MTNRLLVLLVAGTALGAAGCGGRGGGPVERAQTEARDVVMEPPESSLREALLRIDAAMIDLQGAAQVAGPDRDADFVAMRDELADRQSEIAMILGRWKQAASEERLQMADPIARVVGHVNATIAKVAEISRRTDADEPVGEVQSPAP